MFFKRLISIIILNLNRREPVLKISYLWVGIDLNYSFGAVNPFEKYPDHFKKSRADLSSRFVEL